MTIWLLKRANRKNFHKLITNIHDQFTFNMDVYPTTRYASYGLFENHRRGNERTSYNRRQGKGGGCRYLINLVINISLIVHPLILPSIYLSYIYFILSLSSSLLNLVIYIYMCVCV